VKPTDEMSWGELVAEVERLRTEGLMLEMKLEFYRALTAAATVSAVVVLAFAVILKL
jgi:hypothetical protein